MSPALSHGGDAQPAVEAGEIRSCLVPLAILVSPLLLLGGVAVAIRVFDAAYDTAMAGAGVITAGVLIAALCRLGPAPSSCPAYDIPTDDAPL